MNEANGWLTLDVVGAFARARRRRPAPGLHSEQHLDAFVGRHNGLLLPRQGRGGERDRLHGRGSNSWLPQGPASAGTRSEYGQEEQQHEGDNEPMRSLVVCHRRVRH